MSEKRGRKKGLGHSVNKQYRTNKRKQFISLIYLVIAYIIVAGIIVFEIMPKTYSITVGEAAQETIVAIGDVEDTVRTEEARQKARDAVAPVYLEDKDKTDQIRNFFATAFANIKEAAQYGYGIRDGKENSGGYIVQYDSVKREELSKNELSFLADSPDMSVEGAKNKAQKIVAVLDSNPDDVEKLKNWFNQKLEAYLKDGVSENNIGEIKSGFAAEIIGVTEDVTVNQSLKNIIAELVQDKLTVNSAFDEAATENAKEQAAKSVEAVFVKKGTAIVTQNEIVTQNQFDMLEKLGMLKEGMPSLPLLIGSAILILVLSLVIAWYTNAFEKKLVVQPKRILLLCLLIVIGILIALVFKSGGWVMMMNSAVSTILIAVLFGEQLALIVNTALSVIIAMLVSNESGLFTTEAIALMISSYIGGTGAIYVSKNVRVASRIKMLLPGVASGIIGMCVTFVVLWIAGTNVPICITSALFSLAGGIVAALFSAGSISIWESMFNLSTQSKLLELCNSSSELLRKMSIEIPGTYQHCSAVAEMAENGAKDIGANAMLARAASLYHDIGKMRNPECYTENQNSDSFGYHSTLTPEESTQDILSHITEGVRIAKANKLPNEIIDVIVQHHGTSAVMYFYNKAKANNPDVNIDDFRYAGPNPQTKEAGIIMLADCIEASVRSMDEKNTETISAQIEKMFKLRMDDGELDECELTLKDINTLKQSFLQTLLAMYHTRIKYDNAGDKNEGRNS
ncbi:MAG: HDIG domain-containing protein [Clostridia bacterium]|nr:HDIG domain-containing protein [Clostridia bacterium]